MRKVFREIITIEEAKNLLLKHCRIPKEIEEIEIINATDRILAEDVFASVSVPPFDRATMDGYAVKAEDTFTADENNPVKLRVLGRIEAGEWCEFEIKSGEAFEVATGATIPKGANAVVMVEFTRERDGFVEIFKAIAPGENLMSAGSEIMVGEMILRNGTKLSPREIGLLSACGIRKVKVFRRPRIAVISTGNELVEPGIPLELGKIYDVNSYTICSAVEKNGGISIRIGIIKDDEEEIAKAILRGLKIADIVITSGSTSAGFGDRMYRVLEDFADVIVHGIAVKPGKPTIIAIHDRKPIFSLPGYPVSALTIFEILVAPLLREMAGFYVEGEKIEAKLATKVFSEIGRREFLPVNIVLGKDGYSAYPVTGSYSGAISALTFSDGIVEIPEEVLMLEENEKVEVKLFSGINPAEFVFIGSHCIGVNLILKIMKVRAKIINIGSIGGILAVRRGEADVAGTHFLCENGVYNEEMIKKLEIKNAVLVKGYLREQGFIVPKGNPKKIKSFEDLIREDIRLINRNKGSGTRQLLDLHLNELAKEIGLDFRDIIKRIKGYEVEAKTHIAVAVAVANGRADVGIGIKSVANLYDLDFIPIRNEEYDFLIPKDKIEKEVVKKFLAVLNSREFALQLEKVDGLKVYERTGEILEI
ncbi:MAG: molybdopterin biosynthesis protein [Archaeoglobaceae archaeon]|nr:molybdopterin biosynthesis protein [Archaeoglobaceae archaeon]MDW7989930.1 molybdopterin biosynthesis protein [Archaeoglobaceae archaeon]